MIHYAPNRERARLILTEARSLPHQPFMLTAFDQFTCNRTYFWPVPANLGQWDWTTEDRQMPRLTQELLSPPKPSLQNGISAVIGEL
jgi:hypothetical protein